MKLLSGTDSLCLQMERGNQYLHVAGLGIYDPSTAPGGKVRFKQSLDFFSRRLDSAKVFRRRLVAAPFGLDRPYWIDEGEIDTEYHVRHIALPQPGDWRQLMIQVARIHSRPLECAGRMLRYTWPARNWKCSLPYRSLSMASGSMSLASATTAPCGSASSPAVTCFPTRTSSATASRKVSLNCSPGRLPGTGSPSKCRRSAFPPPRPRRSAGVSRLAAPPSPEGAAATDPASPPKRTRAPRVAAKAGE